MKRDFTGSDSALARLACAFDPKVATEANAALSLGLAFEVSSAEAAAALADTLAKPAAAADLAWHLCATGRAVVSDTAAQALSTLLGLLVFGSIDAKDVRPFGSSL